MGVIELTTVLVDMDGVIVDWGEAYGRALDKYGDDAKRIARHAEQKTFDLREGLDYKESLLVDQIMSELDYFDMNIMDGAREALDDMTAWGLNVFICTAPWPGNVKCAGDKLRWVSEHLGSKWTARTIITPDKTMIRGDWLVDDKPKILGSKPPQWTQIMFTQPYNRDVRTPFRMNSWKDWSNNLYA